MSCSQGQTGFPKRATCLEASASKARQCNADSTCRRCDDAPPCKRCSKPTAYNAQRAWMEHATCSRQPCLRPLPTQWRPCIYIVRLQSLVAVCMFVGLCVCWFVLYIGIYLFFLCPGLGASGECLSALSVCNCRCSVLRWSSHLRVCGQHVACRLDVICPLSHVTLPLVCI